MALLNVLLFLLAMVAIVGLAVGLIGLLFKKFRSKAKRIAGVSVAVLLVSVFAGITVQGKMEDTQAQEKGFESSMDEKAAISAGFENASDWLAHKKLQAEQLAAQKAKAKAEEIARQEKAEALARAKLTEAKAAGFETPEDYDAAKMAGITNAAQWQRRKEITARLDRLKKTDSSIVLVEEAPMDDVSGLFIKIKTMGWDGGKRDFFRFASTVSSLAKELRKEQYPYVKIRVGLVIPALDKYGNSDDANGGDVDWKLSELAKVNLDAGPEFVMRAADKVQFKRLGGEMARAYCQDNPDFRDPRYCRRP